MVGGEEAQGRRGDIGGITHGRKVGKFGLTKQSVFTKGCGPNEELDYKLGVGSMPIVQLRYLRYLSGTRQKGVCD